MPWFYGRHATSLAMLWLVPLASDGQPHQLNPPRKKSVSSARENQKSEFLFTRWKTSPDGTISVRLGVRTRPTYVFEPIRIWAEVRNNGDQDNYVIKPFQRMNNPHRFRIKHLRGWLKNHAQIECGEGPSLSAFVRLKPGQVFRAQQELPIRHWPATVLPSEFQIYCTYSMSQDDADRLKRLLEQEKQRQLGKHASQTQDQHSNGADDGPRQPGEQPSGQDQRIPSSRRSKRQQTTSKPKKASGKIWHGPSFALGPITVNKDRLLPANLQATKWVQSTDAKVALRMLSRTRAFHLRETIDVFVEIRNDSTTELVVRNIFQQRDWYTFSIKGPHGEVLKRQSTHEGEYPDYTPRYIYLEPGESYQMHRTFPISQWPGSQKAGEYKISLRHQFVRDDKHRQFHASQRQERYQKFFQQEHQPEETNKTLPDNVLLWDGGKINVGPLTVKRQ